MADQRNFRSHYYEKVGFKGVEEKKSIEILLKEQPLDLTKLSQFCLRFPVPALYRVLLWKVLLGVVPPFQEIHQETMEHRRQQYEDLEEALRAMRKVDSHTPLPEAMLKMYLVEEGTLPFEENKMMQDPDNKNFIAIATAMLEVVDSPVEAYWLAVRFHKLQDKYRDSLHTLEEKTEQYLRREDPDGKLCEHLEHLHSFSVLPLQPWFKSGFAGILPETSFERIWDKVIGGSRHILVFVAVAVLFTFRRPILSMDNMEDMMKYLSQIPPDSGDIIVSKAIEMWQKYGRELTATSSKGESPSLIDKAPS